MSELFSVVVGRDCPDKSSLATEVRAVHCSCCDSAERISEEASKAICGLAASPSASFNRVDAAVSCNAALSVALGGINAAPVRTVCARSLAAMPLPEVVLATIPAAALAIVASSDNCDDREGCAEGHLTSAKSASVAEVISAVCAGLRICD